VHVYLPEQDVTEGLITLQIVEGRFAGVRFDSQPPGLVSAKQIAAIFQARQRVGEPLSSISLDRALLLSDDLPGVSVAGTLVPGEADAETALVLQTTDEPPLYGDVTVDNTGSRATGSERLAANVSFNSPWGGGELLSVNALRTRGSEYGRIAVTAPVGNDGLRLGFSLSSLNYHVVEGLGSQAAAPVRGESDSVGLDLSYPVWRSRLSNLYLLSGVEQKSFINRDTLIRSDYSSVSLRIGLSGNAFDSVGGGGANSASLQWVGGHLTDMVAHSQFDTIDRRYEKLVFGISRQQAVSDEHSLFVSLSGQHAVQGLDSSEKFFIGGSSSVRAYPASELGGERGQVLTGEWRWRPMPVLAVTGFIDVGRVLALPVVEGNPQVRSLLRGKGLTVAWQGPYGLTPKLTWSRREGLNPRPTPSGTDSDGTLKLDRFWLSLTLTF
jgi:hemolysin activation/secretion protein